MADFLYTWPSQNQAPAGTWSASPGLANGYEAAWVADERPERPSRLSAATGYWQVDFGAARRVDLVAIVAHTLVAGATVQVQGGNATPPTTLSTTLTVPALRADDQRWNLWRRLTDVTGYTVDGFRYWRFTIASNSGTCQVGEIWLAAQVHALPLGVQPEGTRDEERLVITHETGQQVLLQIDRGVTVRRLQARVLVKTETDLQTLLEWTRSARGRARPSLVVPSDGDAHDAWLAVFDTTRQSWTRRRGGLREVALALRELSAGAL